MRAFFDTNVIVYAHDHSEAARRNRAIALMERHVLGNDFVLSTQVMVESYNALQRKLLLGREAAYEVVEALADEQVIDTDADLVLRALRLAQQFQLSHWDGLIVQAALDANCAVLYSEDLQAGQRFGDLEVVNPFSNELHEPRSTDALPAAKPKRRSAKR